MGERHGTVLLLLLALLLARAGPKQPGELGAAADGPLSASGRGD